MVFHNTNRHSGFRIPNRDRPWFGGDHCSAGGVVFEDRFVLAVVVEETIPIVGGERDRE